MSLADELSIFLKKKEISIYQIATDIDIERSYLSRMIQGRRPMPFDVFQKIIDNINIAKSEASKIKNLYIEENFGTEEFEKFVTSFKSVYDSEEISSERKMKAEYNFSSEFEVIDSPVTIIALTDSMIHGALNSEEQSHIYTNFDIRFIYDIIKTTQKPENVDYKHIATVMGNGGISSHFTTLFSVMKYNYCGYDINYIESDNTENSLTDSLYPNYIITDKYCLLADENYKSGLFVSNQNYVNACKKKFEAVFEQTTPYLHIQDDIFDLQKLIQNELTENIKVEITCLTSFFNSVLYADHEMYEQFAREEIPNREFVLNIAIAHYNNIASMNIRAIATKRCIENFIDTGIVDTYPPELAKPMSIENRIKVLESFRDNIKSDRIIYRVLKPGFFKNDSHQITNTIDFESYFHEDNEINNFSAFVSLKDDPKNHIGNYTYNISNKQVVEDYNNFVKMLSISDYCYTKDETIQIFEEGIEKLKLM